MKILTQVRQQLPIYGLWVRDLRKKRYSGHVWLPLYHPFYVVYNMCGEHLAGSFVTVCQVTSFVRAEHENQQYLVLGFDTQHDYDDVHIEEKFRGDGLAYCRWLCSRLVGELDQYILGRPLVTIEEIEPEGLEFKLNRVLEEKASRYRTTMRSNTIWKELSMFAWHPDRVAEMGGLDAIDEM